jgi:hypothetical protein
MTAESFSNFFSVMAGAGATLVSVNFIALAMRRGPAVVEGAGRADERQLGEALADALLLGMLGGFVVSALAIVPGVRLAFVALPMSCLSLLLLASIAVRLTRARSLDSAPARRVFRVKTIAPMALGLAVVIGQFCAALRLTRAPEDANATLWLAVSVVGHYGYVLLRSWMWIGGAERGLRAAFETEPATKGRAYHDGREQRRATEAR